MEYRKARIKAGQSQCQPKKYITYLKQHRKNYLWYILLEEIFLRTKTGHHQRQSMRRYCQQYILSEVSEDFKWVVLTILSFLTKFCSSKLKKSAFSYEKPLNENVLQMDTINVSLFVGRGAESQIQFPQQLLFQIIFN